MCVCACVIFGINKLCRQGSRSRKDEGEIHILQRAGEFALFERRRTLIFRNEFAYDLSVCVCESVCARWMPK